MSFPRELSCERCGYHALWSPEPVAAAIPRDEAGQIWLLRRTLHEGAGLWTFPGGYVELGESVQDAARRETREELEMEIELGALVGVYSRASERTVLVVFHARAAAWATRPTRRRRCRRSRRLSCPGTSWHSGRRSRRCATRSRERPSERPPVERGRYVRPAARALFATTVVIGTPSGLSLLGRSARSQRETRAGSVEMMISS